MLEFLAKIAAISKLLDFLVAGLNFTLFFAYRDLP